MLPDLIYGKQSNLPSSLCSSVFHVVNHTLRPSAVPPHPAIKTLSGFANADRFLVATKVACFSLPLCAPLRIPLCPLRLPHSQQFFDLYVQECDFSRSLYRQTNQQSNIFSVPPLCSLWLTSKSYLREYLSGRSGFYTLAAVILVYAAYHLATLKISPLPWFDEVFFASVARSWAEDRSFELLSAPFFLGGKELLTHGPVYFVLTGTMFELFGFDIIPYRMINLISGFIILYLFYRLMKDHLRLTPVLCAVGVGLLALDTVYNMSMHNGRMDIFALLFMLMATWCMVQSGDQRDMRTVLLYALIGGTAGTVAILASPRTGFFFLPLAIILIARAFRKQEEAHWYAIAGWGAPVVLLILAWFLYAFDGVQDMIAHYEVYSVMVTGGVQLPAYQYPLIGLMVSSLLLVAIFNYRLLFTELNLLILSSALLFNTIVFDTGAYSVMIVPFYYLLIMQAATRTEFPFERVRMALVTLLLLMNLGIFSFKGFAVLGTWDERNPEPVHAFIDEHISEGANVIAEEQFYYGVIQAGADFHFSNRLLSTEEREVYLREEFDYEYLIISDELYRNRPGFFEYFDERSELEKVAEYRYEEERSGLVQQMLDMAGFSILTSFDGRIYERQ